jgi:hypothetical protein
MTRLGTLSFHEKTGKWVIDCTPDLMLRLKRIFPRMEKSKGVQLRVKDAPDVAADLEWVMLRYPLTMAAGDRARLETAAGQYRAKLERISNIMERPPLPGAFEMTFPPRDYQAQAAALFLEQGHLLLGDQVGLGKTVSAIAAMTERRILPAVVVVKTHLAKQWKEEVHRFLPLLEVHIIKSTIVYELPPADVYLITYSKLAAWYAVLAERCKTVVYDEIQELRVRTSQKYQAAQTLSTKATHRLGLSATPIYNYGGEIWNVFNLLCSDALGTFEEFQREWCHFHGQHSVVTNPEALGAFLRNNRLMLRRTRKEVGRELQPVCRYVQEVEFDKAVYDRGTSAATELARIMLSGSFLERGQAARQFDLEVRQATGLAKAPFVAELVRMLIESGEKVLLGGWHRAVYEIWRDRLKDFRPAFFTGSESPTQKEAARQAFIKGETDLLIMSLRSGAGTNGLQNVSSVCVLGEMDWSPAVHEQFIGRLARDGQEDSVQVFIPVAPVGCDPAMASVLGIKDAQATGIVDLGVDVDMELLETDPARLKKLARDFLVSKGMTPPTEEPNQACA